MAQNTINFFELSFDAINAMNNKDLVREIEKLRGKVIVDNNIKNLCLKYLVYQKTSPSLWSRMKNLVASLSL